MKRKSEIALVLSLAMALVLGLAQCKKKVEQITPAAAIKMVDITLGVDGSKHVVYPGTGVVAYTDGDVLHVGNNGKYLGTLTYSDGVFSGSIAEPSTADYLHFFFVGGLTPSEAPEIGSTTSFTVNIADQSTKLPVLSYGKSTEKYTDASSVYSTVLMNRCGLVKFVPSAATSNDITVGGMKTIATVNFATPGITPEGTTGAVTLYSETNKAKWAILLPQEAVSDPTVTIDSYASTIENVPAVTNNMYYTTGVNINMVAAATVTTAAVTTFTNTTATMGGNVTSDGGGTISERGIYYSTTSPVTDETGTKLAIGTGTGEFSQEVTGLTANTTYYVRAFATNSNGTSYGEEITFITKDLPTVTTNAITAITNTSAKSGGVITFDGNGTISAKGVCWSTSENPTIDDAHTNDGSGTGSFTSNITGLTIMQTYYVRAYATNEIGTTYGEQRSFTAVPEGGINGSFTINASGKQVCFSKGNLQAKFDSQTGYYTCKWQFAEHQWDYIGNATANTDVSEGLLVTSYGCVDLFGWVGASAPLPAYGICSRTDDVSYGYVDGEALKQDWGHNPITNGGNTADMWRTLTGDEWKYVFDLRTTTSGLRYAKATVNGKAGVILLPDDWSSSYYSLNSTNTSDAAFTSNSISADDWTNSLESHGAVFLPCGGHRKGTTVDYVGSDGVYWSSTSYLTYAANSLFLNSDIVNPSNLSKRLYGVSVRLVVEL